MAEKKDGGDLSARFARQNPAAPAKPGVEQIRQRVLDRVMRDFDNPQAREEEYQLKEGETDPYKNDPEFDGTNNSPFVNALWNGTGLGGKGLPWCTIYALDVYNEAYSGMLRKAGNESVPKLRDTAIKNGIYTPMTTEKMQDARNHPKPGDIIIYDHPDSTPGKPNGHTAIVHSVEYDHFGRMTAIYEISGNAGDRVDIYRHEVMVNNGKFYFLNQDENGKPTLKIDMNLGIISLEKAYARAPAHALPSAPSSDPSLRMAELDTGAIKKPLTPGS